MSASASITTQSCTICYEPYDLNDHKPVQFTTCTHGSCETCAQKLFVAKVVNPLIVQVLGAPPREFTCHLCRRTTTSSKNYKIKNTIIEQIKKAQKDESKRPEPVPMASRVTSVTPSSARAPIPRMSTAGTPFIETSRPDSRSHHRQHAFSRLSDFSHASIPSVLVSTSIPKSKVFSLENLKAIKVNGHPLGNYAICAGLIERESGKFVEIFLKDETLSVLTPKLKEMFPSCVIKGNTFTVSDVVLISAMKF